MSEMRYINIRKSNKELIISGTTMGDYCGHESFLLTPQLIFQFIQPHKKEGLVVFIDLDI